MSTTYRARDIHGDLVYRKNLGTLLKRCLQEGTVVESREGKFGLWIKLGIAHNGQLLEGDDYIRAAMIKHQIAASYFIKEWMTVSYLLEKGSVKFPARQCGYDNSFSCFKMARVIEYGDEHYYKKPEANSHTEGAVYHYVVTEYGEKILRLAIELFGTDKMRERFGLAEVSANS